MDSKGVSRIDVYNLENQSRQGYPLSSWQSKDDHNNPAILKLRDGQILACYAQHGSQRRWYWRMDNKTEVGLEWQVEKIFETPVGTTYCNLMQLSGENGRIYNFSRNVGLNPNVQYSDDNAQSWYGPFVLIKSGDDKTRPYVKYADNGVDRIDFLYTDGHPRNEPTNNVYHIYYQAGSFYKSDGVLIKSLEEMKTKPMVPSDGTLVYDGSSEGRGWVWDLEYDKEGNPVAVFINSVDHEVGNDLRYRYGRWDAVKKQWSQQQIAFAGTHLYVPENHYAGGIAIDPEDVNTVYISCNVEPASGKANTTGRHQIHQGQTRDNGKNWVWKQLTFNTEVDNLRPIVPREHGGEICVVWFQGRYNTYTDYETKIMGYVSE